MFIKCEKVVLRPLGPEDVPLLTKWINDPGNRRFVTNRFPMDEAAEAEWVKSLNKDRVNPKDVVLGIALPESSKLIGSIGLHGINWIDRIATTGTIIGEEEYRSKGFATDAKMCLLEYAFNTLGLRKICSNVIVYNEASLAYARKCGYVEEGRQKSHMFKDGIFHDVVFLAIFEKDFRKVWEEHQKK